MDGWETRRKRVAGHDWAIIRLGEKLRQIYAVEVDTAHFTGNHAPRVSVEVANITAPPGAEDSSSQQQDRDDNRWMPGAMARVAQGGGIQGTGRTPEEVDEAERACRTAAKWTKILPQTPLRPGYEGSSVHCFVLSKDASEAAGEATHVRINYYPDGGVARLKLWGKPVEGAAARAVGLATSPSSSNDSPIGLPRPISATSVMNDSVYNAQQVGKDGTATQVAPAPPAPLDIKSNWVAYSAEPYPHPELSSSKLGGAGLACSNKHYGVPNNLIQPTYGKDMGDGWETARHPDRPAVWAKKPNGLMDSPLQDWAVIKLGRPAQLGVSRIILDTRHFRGNFPESARVEGCCAPSDSEEADAAVCEATPERQAEGGVGDVEWFTLLPRTKLGPDAEHVFERTNGTITNGDRPVTHVRVTIMPDGGLSRVRIYGDPSTSHIESHL